MASLVDVNLISFSATIDRLPSVEPEEFVYGYDLYTAMPDGLLGATPPIDDSWFEDTVDLPYPYDGVPQEEKTIHQKMYELSSKNLNIGGSETLT